MDVLLSRASRDASSGELDLVLNKDTNPDDVIIHCGHCFRSASERIDRVHAYVTWLRSIEYRIHNDTELEHVTKLLERGFPNAEPAALGNYARTFRSLLSCENLPDNFLLPTVLK